MNEDREFDWRADAEDVVLPDQPATAVYVNPRGAVVIRQTVEHDDDVWIIVQPSNAAALAKAILRAAGLTEDALEASPAPKDRTAAERQRRYRARQHRDGDGVTRNGHAVTDAPLLMIEGRA